MIEIAIIVTGVFAFLSAVLGWQIVPLRIAGGIFFIAYGLLSFPYHKEDKHKIGLAVGCFFFSVSGILAMTLGSWWPLAGGVVVGYSSALLFTRLFTRRTRGSLFRARLPPQASTFAKDNFEYIALNMALIRLALETRWGDRFPDEKSLFIACGVIDTIRHIGEGHFTARAVANAMLRANTGVCQLGLSARVPIEEDKIKSFFFPTNLFLNYTLQIEAMVFNAIEQHVDASGMSEQDIVLTVMSQKERIEKVLGTPTEELEASELMKGVQTLTDAFMNESEFSEYRKEIGLDSDE